ncbi:hypothetical protein GS682_25010 [Nostoc sp. B(2019)]|uniref:hypothetical protein n=1 Tax=Nostoc sp. MG11 TaxID=2721166 RepID=UPI0013908F4A|nr:hypothetical protein [Nostoc sp. MG11]NDJ24845.1 hypothetical protein [Nostoc sp. B(2019)]
MPQVPSFSIGLTVNTVQGRNFKLQELAQLLRELPTKGIRYRLVELYVIIAA